MSNTKWFREDDLKKEFSNEVKSLDETRAKEIEPIISEKVKQEAEFLEMEGLAFNGEIDLGDDYSNWLIYEGDLTIDNLFLEELWLIVTGNLTIKGSFCEKYSRVIVLGDIKAENIVSGGDVFLVLGDTNISGLIMNYSCEEGGASGYVGNVKCKAFYTYEKYSFILGGIDAEYHSVLENEFDEINEYSENFVSDIFKFFSEDDDEFDDEEKEELNECKALEPNKIINLLEQGKGIFK